MTIGKHEVGFGKPVFVVAELSCNHRGSYKKAVETIRAMADAGADAVKLQIDDPNGGITVDSDRPEFRITSGPWAGKTLYKLYRETYTPWEWVPELTGVARALGLECFTTPSCVRGVQYLESIQSTAYKISSFEITDHELIDAVAATGKPCILSMGCAAPLDLLDAVWIFNNRSNLDYLFLECVSDYPAVPGKFDLCQGVEGISDHSTGNAITWAAVALGARVVERHFILARGMGGPDAGFSLDPEEFAVMVDGIRDIESAMRAKTRVGNYTFTKSVFAARDIASGEMVTREDLLVIRPGAGAHPRDLRLIVGKAARRAIAKHEPVQIGDVG
jgi:pseudaminic acid synthase